MRRINRVLRRLSLMQSHDNVNHTRYEL